MILDGLWSASGGLVLQLVCVGCKMGVQQPNWHQSPNKVSNASKRGLID
jgi:hypothetical protein